MPIYNQGFACSCDNCQEQAASEIGSYSRAQIRKIAQQSGMIELQDGKWFCNRDCLSEFVGGMPPGHPDTAIAQIELDKICECGRKSIRIPTTGKYIGCCHSCMPF